MLIPLLASLAFLAPDTLRVYNSHDHEMAVVGTIGGKTIEFGVVPPGDTGKFAVTIPAGVTKIELRVYPPDNPLGQITFVLDVVPGKRLLWSFDDSQARGPKDLRT